MVVGIVIVLLLLVGAGGAAAAYYFLNNGRTPAPSGGTTGTAETYESLFYSYANDIIYGKESTEPIIEDVPSSQYAYHSRIYNGSDSDQEYFNQIYQKYEAFYNSLQQDEQAREVIGAEADDYGDD